MPKATPVPQKFTRLDVRIDGLSDFVQLAKRIDALEAKAEDTIRLRPQSTTANRSLWSRLYWLFTGRTA